MTNDTVQISSYEILKSIVSNSRSAICNKVHDMLSVDTVVGGHRGMFNLFMKNKQT